MNTCIIHGIGTYVPSRMLTNDDLSRIVDTNDEWITTRTGIKKRHVLADDENASDAGLHAAQQALADAGLDAKSVTHVLVATCTPDYLCPSVACILAGKLGCNPVMALDFNAACSGFIYGLDMARSIIAANPDATILLISSEALTRRVNWQDRSTCVLFGDGAGAIVLRGGQHGAGMGQIKDTTCLSDGTLWELITIGGGTKKRYELEEPVGEDFFLHMQGREVFKHAVRNMASICQTVLTRNNMTINDVDLLVPHQANVRIIEAVGSRLDMPAERVFINVHEYGNTSSASVVLALADARAQGRLKPGSQVLAASFGAGLTWGAVLLQF